MSLQRFSSTLSRTFPLAVPQFVDCLTQQGLPIIPFSAKKWSEGKISEIKFYLCWQ